MYSDMSKRIILSDEPKSSMANCLESSVLPTPVGPTNRKLPIDPWIDKGSAIDLIKSFSYDDSHFDLKLNQLDRMVYVWYQTRLTQPVEESHNPVNRIKLHADVISNSYKSTIHLDGGCGDAIGDNLIHFN